MRLLDAKSGEIPLNTAKRWQADGLLFTQSLVFKLPKKTRLLGTKSFVTLFGIRSVEWTLLVRLPYTIELQRVTPNIHGETFPSGKYRFGCLFKDDKIGLRDGFYSRIKPLTEASLDFRDDFAKKVNSSLKIWRFKAGSMTVTVELIFKTNDYLTYRLPDESKPTEQQERVRKALAEELETLGTDLDIDASDGIYPINRCIPFSYSGYFQEMLTGSSFVNVIMLPYPIQIFQKVQNALLFDALSFDNCSQEEITLFISCAHYLRSNFGKGSVALVNAAETELIKRFCQCWHNAYLEKVLEYLDVSQKYALTSLRQLVLNVVVDRHYAAFRYAYNSRAKGHEKEIFDKLSTVSEFSDGHSTIRHYNIQQTLDDLRRSAKKTKLMLCYRK